MRRVRQGGFTLIELMITVAILSILMAVAYPAYTQHIVRANRAAAQSFMFTVANRQEQAMLNSRGFFPIADGTAAQWTAAMLNIPADVLNNYTVTVALTTGPPPTYAITAAPKTPQSTRDVKCGTLTLSNTGVKDASGSSGAAECWR